MHHSENLLFAPPPERDAVDVLESLYQAREDTLIKGMVVILIQFVIAGTFFVFLGDIQVMLLMLSVAGGTFLSFLGVYVYQAVQAHNFKRQHPESKNVFFERSMQEAWDAELYQVEGNKLVRKKI